MARCPIRYAGRGLRQSRFCRHRARQSAPDYFSCGDKESESRARFQRHVRSMDRVDRWKHPRSGRARTRADAECLCDDAHQRRFGARSHRARRRAAARARTESARPLNALHARAPAANALSQCDDVGDDRIPRANNAAPVWFPAPVAIRPTSEFARATTCGLLSPGELIRW